MDFRFRNFRRTSLRNMLIQKEYILAPLLHNDRFVAVSGVRRSLNVSFSQGVRGEKDDRSPGKFPTADYGTASA